MPFLRSILESLFGGGENHRMNQGNHDQRIFGDKFRNPIWQNDEEDDDEYGEDYRHPGHSPPAFHFEIFTNPFEMTRYFESQMDNLMKDFFSFGLTEDNQMPSNPLQRDLRDEVLKPGYALPPPNYGLDSSKCDEDLDGKVDAKDLSRVWNGGATESSSIPMKTFPRDFTSRSFGQSIVSQTIRRSDGSIEEKRTTTDNEGNTETIVKHKMGDKAHTVVIKKDKNGVETQTENFENMDPNELNNLNKNWRPTEDRIIEPGTLTAFPWNKLFNFSPKL